MPGLSKNKTRARRVLLWLLASATIAAALLFVAVSLALRSTALKERVEELLTEELESEVELATLEGRLFPKVSLVGEGLVVRHKGRTDVPPLLKARRFVVEGSALALLFPPRHVALVRLEGLEVQIPPDNDEEDGEQPEMESAKEPEDDEQANASEVIVDRVETMDARLVLIPRNRNKPPRVFAIHHLVMSSVSPSHQMPFIATLTNPKPIGEIETSGTFGPWRVSSPARTPVSGRYVFARADLGTIKGLGGILSSDGTFEGLLKRIDVRGETDTPDFRVDVSGQPVPLHTRYHAIVDGTNGDTILKRVDASFLDTSMVAVGAVTGTEGMPGRTIQIDVTMEKGRIEDLLKLAVRSKEPVLTGAAQMKAKLRLAPGAGSVVDRLELTGDFGLTQATFTDDSVQAKIAGLSRRGQGKKNEEDVGKVLTDLQGRFVFDKGVATFSRLMFGVPGAVVQLSGRYGLRSEQLDFRGSLRMQATISQAAGGGIKSIFLKVFDPFFRKPGAGAVVPIKITGTRESPKFGLDLF